MVNYGVIGGTIQRLPLVPTESAQLSLSANTQYNIFVKAILNDNHRVHGAWSDTLKVNTKDFGKFIPFISQALRVFSAFKRWCKDTGFHLPPFFETELSCGASYILSPSVCDVFVFQGTILIVISLFTAPFLIPFTALHK